MGQGNWLCEMATGFERKVMGLRIRMYGNGAVPLGTKIVKGNRGTPSVTASYQTHCPNSLVEVFIITTSDSPL